MTKVLIVGGARSSGKLAHMLARLPKGAQLFRQEMNKFQLEPKPSMGVKIFVDDFSLDYHRALFLEYCRRKPTYGVLHNPPRDHV